MRAIRSVSIFLIAALALSCLPAAALAYSMPYYIKVDLTNNITTVYSSLDDSVVRQMICSSGTGKYQSPTGTYTMPEKRKSTERGDWYTFEDGYGKYGSRIVGSYLFHSFLFEEKDDSKVDWETYAAMGTSASHGCIRLYIDDAKWIADNCMPGTKVTLAYNDTRYEYLKELLYEQTYSIDSGLTYAEFVCMASSEDEIGYYSSGDDVTALQERMIELGLYSGEADGFYDEKMVRAVKAVQAVLGLRVTGVVDKNLLDIINSDNAPSSTISTLSEGMSGPAVRSLQQMLASLGLYNGNIDGVFDAEITEAVMAFQRACGDEPNGVATAATQQDMLDSFELLEETYGDTGYALTYEEVIVETATINASKRLNVRAKKSTDSTIVDRIDPGAEVQIIERGESWTKISRGDTEGYVKTSYLDIQQSTVLTPKYVAADAANPALPAPVYGDRMIRTRKVIYGTVNTENRLLIREAPDSDAELVFMLSSGNVCEIISVNEGWAYISYGDKRGFTQAKYFDVEETAELTAAYVNAGETKAVETFADEPMALVISDEGASVMSAASDGSEVMALLSSGDRVDVIFESTAWTQIRIGETTGYVRNELIFIGTADEIDAYLEELAAPEIAYAVVDTGSDAQLKLRAMPSSDGDVLCMLDNLSLLTVVQDDGEWAQVEYGMYSGYVMSQYIVPAESADAAEEDIPAEAFEEEAPVGTAESGAAEIKETDGPESSVEPTEMP